MPHSPHAYVRGSTVRFYDWLDQSAGKVPEGPAVWICGDCHVGNLGPPADAKGAHSGQMDAATRKAWRADLLAAHTSCLEAPSWLWSNIVELLGIHEAAYLDHCRRFALAAAA